MSKRVGTPISGVDVDVPLEKAKGLIPGTSLITGRLH